MRLVSRHGRRRLGRAPILATLCATAVSLLAIGASAPAARAMVPASSKRICVVHSLHSFIEAGEKEFHSSLADIIEVECQPVYAGSEVTISDTELYDQCHGELFWSEIQPFEPEKGPSHKVKLDNDGNAIVVVLGGPGCASGKTLVVADLEAAPFPTAETEFVVKSPTVTPPGVYAEPPTEVETDTASDVATIVHVEFPAEYAEDFVNVKTTLFGRCKYAPKVVWVGSKGEVLASETDELKELQLDDDGNAFVVLLGEESCAAGSVLIEASLEESPFTTVTTKFTIEPPRPTIEEANYTIEKLQKLTGEYTTKELTGSVGETIHYEILVKNTGEVPLKFSNFSDPGCTDIKGGVTELMPGETATWTCEEKITEHRIYKNVATVEGSDGTGPKESNEVVVKVKEPLLKIEKLQKITGEYTKSELEGKVGETVFYEIVIKNEGNIALRLSSFKDPKCTNIVPGLSELNPGESTIWKCEHKLTEKGKYTNVASVEANEGVGEKKSNEVVVKVLVSEEKKALEKPAFTIKKLQELEGSGAGFTAFPLKARLGETVDYELIVTNIGPVPLTFADFIDTKCENIKGGPGPKEEVLPGESRTYTCEHTITARGSWVNYGTVTGTTPGGVSLTHTSNEVVVYN